MGFALSIISLASSAIGAGMGIMGQVGANQAGQAQAAYQAQVAKNNATIARYNQQMAEYDASIAAQKGEAAATAQGLKDSANFGAIKAGQAASGVDVNSGSAVDVQSSAAALGELNSMTIKSDSAREAYGYRLKGYGYGLQEKSYLDEAKLIKAGAPTGADLGLSIASSVIGAASSISESAFKFKQAGAFSSGSGAGGGGNNVLGTETLGGGVY